jgi:hypothetical protein
MRKNRWVLKDNQHSSIIRKYLEFSCKSNLDELTNMDTLDIERLLLKYANSLSHKNKASTIESKISTVVMFYSYNGIEINIDKFYEESIGDTSYIERGSS